MDYDSTILRKRILRDSTNDPKIKSLPNVHLSRATRFRLKREYNANNKYKEKEYSIFSLTVFSIFFKKALIGTNLRKRP